MQQQQKTSPLTAPLHSREEAINLSNALEKTLAELSVVLTLETQFAKAGKLRDAINLQPDKARLTNEFIQVTERFRANVAFYKQELPQTIEKVRKLHEKFHVEVARNMAALATAKALAESLISEVVNAAQEHERPSGYTTDGKSPTPKANTTPPLKLNLSL